MVKQLNPNRDAIAVWFLREFNQTHFERTVTRERSDPFTIKLLRRNEKPSVHLHDSRFESLGCRHVSHLSRSHEREPSRIRLATYFVFGPPGAQISADC